ncbi:DMT family transporter [Candidatus Aminicenantes bacterium AC-334-K16]|jgi:drug/metabolite transporter (DMT)-like permease|nr:DMT family transporter [Candidatus Aminicenantes bacterium AC-334-K16]
MEPVNSFLHQLFFTGEFLALLSAVLWAIAIILFRLSGKIVQPLGLNFSKNAISLILVGLTMVFLGEKFYLPLPLSDYLLLLISGLIGLGLSDTLLFAGLNRLGASRLAIINCSYSPFMIILSVIFLGERLTPLQIIGVLLIISSVWLLSSREEIKESESSKIIPGIIFGLSAMMTQAVSIVMIKPALNHLPLLWSTELRTLGGLIFLGLVLLFHPLRREITQPLLQLKNWRYIFLASFLGSYLAIIAWLGGMKYTLISIAAALSQTNIIFIFILGVIFLKEKLTLPKILAFLGGLAGSALVTFF